MKKNNFNKYLNLIQKNCSDGIGNLHLLNSFFYQNLIIDAAKIIIQCFKKNKKILVCGNGGSAADSQHFAAELVGKFLIKKRKSYPAIALSTNNSIITSIANDSNFNLIFSRQVESLGKINDILLLISTSGKSINIINAAKAAKKIKLKTILLSGDVNFKLKNLVDLHIPVPAYRVDRIQELHILVLHCISEIIEKELS